MTTTRLTTKTAADAARLKDKLAEIARLTNEAEALKWSVLDSREVGTQTLIAGLYGVRRQAVGQWIAAREAARTVARRSLETGRLYCTAAGCAPKDGDALEPLKSEDLPDGGVCAECGIDVLIEDTRKTA